MIYLGADKHGLRAIQFVQAFLASRNIEFENIGIQSEDEDIKLQVLIPKVVSQVLEDEGNKAIISCGTGVGVEVGANKFSGIRACLATSERIAEYSRVYDDCNVLCLVGWEVEKDKVEKIVGKWLSSEYDGNENRLEMFRAFDTWH